MAKDVGWDHGVKVPNPTKDPKLVGHVICNYCHKETTGGIYRLKHHLAGTKHGVSMCEAVPPDVKRFFQNHLKDQRLKKEELEQNKLDIGRSVYFGSSTGDNVNKEASGSGSDAKTSAAGPMDLFVNKEARQTTINTAFKRDERKNVCRAIGRFFYANALSFNLCNSPYFGAMVEAIANYGRGFKPPSYHEIRTWILKDEVDCTHEILKEFKKEWPKVGCSIMADGWTDGKGRNLINFLVNSSSGTVFLKSVDISDMEKTGANLCKLFEEVVKEVGESNVVQFITDNAPNYVAAGNMLTAGKTCFWTPCAAHCLDLMLEDIGKISIFKDTVEKAKKITRYIYSHAWVLNLMRKFTKKKELLRPAVTRFATTYLTLHSIGCYKKELKSMFLSSNFRTSNYYKKSDAKNISYIVLNDHKFWAAISYAIKATLPLVKVLRLVDADEPAMGFLYEAMDRAKEEIASNLDNVQRKYKPIWDIIDRRWDLQLHKPLHAAAYYLNPHFHYADNFNPDGEVMGGFYDCVEKLVSDANIRLKITTQIDAFKKAKGLFGREAAVTTRKLKSPGKFAIMLLFVNIFLCFC